MNFLEFKKTYKTPFVSVQLLRNVYYNNPDILDNPKKIKSLLKKELDVKVKAEKQAKKDKIRETQKYWRKLAWTEFARYIKKRDHFTCCTCGKTLKDFGQNRAKMHAGHWLHGSMVGIYHELNFSEYNIHAQCHLCNYNDGECGLYAEFLIKKYGTEIIETINKLRATLKKNLTSKELEEIYTKYKNL